MCHSPYWLAMMAVFDLYITHYSTQKLWIWQKQYLDIHWNMTVIQPNIYGTYQSELDCLWSFVCNSWQYAICSLNSPRGDSASYSCHFWFALWAINSRVWGSIVPFRSHSNYIISGKNSMDNSLDQLHWSQNRHPQIGFQSVPYVVQYTSSSETSSTTTSVDLYHSIWWWVCDLTPTSNPLLTLTHQNKTKTEYQTETATDTETEGHTTDDSWQTPSEIPKSQDSFWELSYQLSELMLAQRPWKEQFGYKSDTDTLPSFESSLSQTPLFNFNDLWSEILAFRQTPQPPCYAPQQLQTLLKTKWWTHHFSMVMTTQTTWYLVIT